MFDNPAQLIRSYEPYQVFIEMLVIWICVYVVFRFLRGTRGAGIFKGFAILFVIVTLVIRVLSQDSDAFGRLNFIYDRFLGLLAIVLIVIFQPELRQAMIRLSHTRHFRSHRTDVKDVIDSVSEAAEFLSKNQFGALIAIERSVKLGGLVEGGQEMDAKVSSRLLESIFWPNSPLHDLGVVIRENRIVAAGVQFPLAEEGPAACPHRVAASCSSRAHRRKRLPGGDRERGNRDISLSESGQIQFDIPRNELAAILQRRLTAQPRRPSASVARTNSKSCASRAIIRMPPDRTDHA